MTLKFIKKSLFTLSVFAFLLAFFPITSKASGTISYLTATVGETYDTVGINYHCSEDGSYVIYSKTSDGKTIANPIKVEANSTLWHMDAYTSSDAESGYGFSERYVCKATLTRLDANTKYYYQVVSGDSVSNIQSFTTTGTNKDNKSFLFLTDIQSSGGSFQNAETLIQAILRKNMTAQPNLVVMTGDQVDRGGVEQQWIDYYKYVTSLQGFLQATVPGNHEYYLNLSGEYVSNEVFKQFHNYPENGPADRIGSSYYFVWDQILFIMLDTVKTNYDVQAQQDWFRNVVKNNPSQWIIVGSHPGLYATGAYVSDANVMRRNWLSVFEECQVDLALNGHEHVYCRKNLRYGGTAASPSSGPVDEKLGVTYLQGAAAGLKNYSEKIQPSLLKDYDKVLKGLNNLGVLVRVEANQLTIQCYNAAGTVLDEFTLEAKRPQYIEEVSDAEILDSVSVSYDKETEKVTIQWGDNLYGIVSDIHVTGGNKIDVSMPIVSNNVTSRSWSGYYTDYNYHFQVELTKYDGTTLNKDLPLILNEDILEYPIVYDLDGGTNHPDNPTTYTGAGLPLALYAPTKSGYVFTGWKLNRKIITEIPEGTQGEITLVATWEAAKYHITYDLNGGSNSGLNPISFYTNRLPITLYPATKEHYEFVGWQLGDDIITALPEGIISDITLKAVWKAETYTLNYNLDGGTLPQDAPQNFTIDAIPTLPTPTKDGYQFTGWKVGGRKITSLEGITGDTTLIATWEKAKGCKKSLGLDILASITLLTTALIVLRKKYK